MLSPMSMDDTIPLVVQMDLGRNELSFLRHIMNDKIMGLDECALHFAVDEINNVHVNELCFKIGRDCDVRGGDGRWFKRNKAAVLKLADVIKNKIYPVSDRIMRRNGSEILLLFSRFDKEYKAVYRAGQELRLVRV